MAVAAVVAAVSASVLAATISRRPAPLAAVSRQPSTPAAPAVGGGWLSAGSNYVAFIQWARSGQYVRGSAQLVEAMGQPPSETTSSQTLGVDGSLTGSILSISFDGGAEQFGKLSGGGFTLNVPQQDGTLTPLTFAPAATTRFDDAVTALSTQVATTNRAETQAEDQQKAEQAVQDDISSIGTAEQSLQSAVGSVQQDAAAFPHGLQQQSIDVAHTLADEQKVQAESPSAGADNSGVCTDADGVGTDADTVETDADTVGSQVDAVTGDEGDIRRDMSVLSAAFDQLGTDVSAAGGYEPAGIPSAASIQAASAQASGALSAAAATVASAVSQANAASVTAVSYANAAYTAGGCGVTAPPPTPIGS